MLDYELDDGTKDYSSKKPVNGNDMHDFGKKIMGVYFFDDTIRYYYGVRLVSVSLVWAHITYAIYLGLRLTLLI